MIKSVFITVVILSSFRSYDPHSRNFIVKEVATSKVDTVLWLDNHMKIGDTVQFELESYKTSRYGYKPFTPTH